MRAQYTTIFVWQLEVAIFARNLVVCILRVLFPLCNKIPSPRACVLLFRRRKSFIFISCSSDWLYANEFVLGVRNCGGKIIFAPPAAINLSCRVHTPSFGKSWFFPGNFQEIKNSRNSGKFKILEILQKHVEKYDFYGMFLILWLYCDVLYYVFLLRSNMNLSHYLLCMSICYIYVVLKNAEIKSNQIKKRFFIFSSLASLARIINLFLFD